MTSANLSNHNFGYNFLDVNGNWPTQWNKAKYLINNIELYQVHGGKYNMITLVNPRISAFNHDTLNYAGNDRVLELTFTFEYEYAFYNTDNLPIYDNASGQKAQANIGQLQNFFQHGATMDLPEWQFNTSLIDNIESSNPITPSMNPLIAQSDLNTQMSLGSLQSAFNSNIVVNPSSIRCIERINKGIAKSVIIIEFSIAYTTIIWPNCCINRK